MGWIKVILLLLLLGVIILLLVVGVKCRRAVGRAQERLLSYGAKNIALSYGNMSYVDKGEGEVILSIHGIFGGYDQAYDSVREFEEYCRIIAPSRFGYLGSDTKGSGTPREMAEAYVELLDRLGVEKVYLLATSAGGTIALRFALDYPERTKGVILYSSAMPYEEKPEKVPAYAGPPGLILSDYLMYIMSPFFEEIMGMDPSTIDSMLPVGKRREGVVIDSSLTNLDMGRNYDEYLVEKMDVPLLVFHAHDDKLASFADTEKALKRFKNVTFVPFEDGGHLLEGHGDEVRRRVLEFIGGKE